MKFLSIILLTITTLIFSACSKSPGKTDTKFKIGIAAITDINTVGAGGAMLWGKSDKGDMFGSVIQPGSSLDLDLANGQWTFWAVAWEGASDVYNFKGAVRCAKSGATLNGSNISVAISLSNTTCATADFTPAPSIDGGLNQFPAIKHFECNKVTDNFGYGCGKMTLAAPKSTSKRLIMPSFKKAAAGALVMTGTALVSECKLSTNDFSTEHLPIGGNGFPAVTILESFFSAADCNETDPKGFVKDIFEMGLNTPKATALSYINNGTCNTMTFNSVACAAFGGSYSGNCYSVQSAISLDISPAVCTANGGTFNVSGTIQKFELITAIPDEVLCSGPRINPSNATPIVFAAGNGTTATPYSICTETQLNLIKADYPSASFALHADLDMNKTSVFGDGSQTAPTCTNNDPSINFVPIGGLYDGSCNEVNATNYAGVFEGYNHSISNIRLKAKGDDVGFIRQGGTIQNLTLNNMDVEGKSNVGAFVGTNPDKVLNLNLNDSKIRGQSTVGGIVGTFSTSAYQIENVHAKNVVIDYDHDMAGGVLAFSGVSNLTITKSSFEGMIKSQGMNTISGGMIGQSSSTVVIQNSYSSGAMLFGGSASSYAGGLVGSADYVGIDGSYSRMSIGPSIYASVTGGSVGGLIGSTTSGATAANSYFYGAILLPCNDQENGTCPVGSLLGNATLTSNTNSFGHALATLQWFATEPFENTSQAIFESTTTKNALLSGGSAIYNDVGTWAPRFKWETGPCILPANNATVAVQSAVRGSLLNPIIICNKDQWMEISSHLNLNYALEDNIVLGNVATTNRPDGFSGTINGKGHYVSGFYTNTAIAENGGLFKSTAAGSKIFDVHFATSYVTGIYTGLALNIGVVGTNNGDMIKNTFEGINVKGTAMNQGIAAGVNNGSIAYSRVEGKIAIDGNAGHIAGENSGVITAVKTSGRLDFAVDASSLAYAGGAVGFNTTSGQMFEVTAGVDIDNTNNGNINTRYGGLIGRNAGHVTDALVEPHVRITQSNNAPLYGQAFGLVGASSVVTRVLALNDLPIIEGAEAYGHSFAAEDLAPTSGYVKSFIVDGSTFIFHSTPYTVQTCSLSSDIFTYTMTSPYSNDGNYPDGYYFMSGQMNGERLSLRITGTHTNSTSVLTSDATQPFRFDCGTTDGVHSDSTSTFYMIKSQPSFSAVQSGVVSLSPTALGTMSSYCPTASGQNGNYNFKCPAADFDIVEDKMNGVGFLRLLGAYKDLVINKNYAPAARPIWKVEPGGTPRLFIND